MVSRIIGFLGRNALAITCAGLIVFLQMLPHAILLPVFSAAGRAYHPVTPMSIGGNYPVFPHRIQEYLEGKTIISDPNLWEYRSGPWSSRPPLPALFFAAVGFVVGRPWFFPVAETVGAVTIFCVLTGFLTALTGARRLSALWAFFICTGAMLTAFDLFPVSREELATAVKLLVPFSWGESWIPRMQFYTVEAVVPALIVQMGFLWALHRFIAAPVRRTAIWLGLLFGLTFYTYPFYWMFDSVVLGMLGLVWLGQRKFRPLGWLCLAGGIGAAVSALFWVMFFSLRQLPQYHQILDRTSQTEFGRFVRWSDWKFYILLTAGWLSIWQLARRAWVASTLPLYFGVLFLAVIAGHNMQLVVGFTLSPDHWISRGLYLPFALLLGVLGAAFWQRVIRPHVPVARPWMVPALAWLLAAYVLCGAASAQARLTVRLAATHLLPAPVTDVLAWIDRELPEDAVVMTPSLFISELIPYETKARVFVPQVWNTVAPFSELRERWFMTLRLVGASEEWVRSSFHQTPDGVPFSLTKRLVRFGLDPRNYLIGFGFREWQDDAPGTDVVHISEAAIDSFVAEYRATSLQGAVESLKRYQADYLLVTAGDLPVSAEELPVFASWERVYDQRGITIYRIPL